MLDHLRSLTCCGLHKKKWGEDLQCQQGCAAVGREHQTGARHDTATDYREDPLMLWTILIILAIVALVVFILGRARGGRGV